MRHGIVIISTIIEPGERVVINQIGVLILRLPKIGRIGEKARETLHRILLVADRRVEGLPVRRGRGVEMLFGHLHIFAFENARVDRLPFAFFRLGRDRSQTIVAESDVMPRLFADVLAISGITRGVLATRINGIEHDIGRTFEAGRKEKIGLRQILIRVFNFFDGAVDTREFGVHKKENQKGRRQNIDPTLDRINCRENLNILKKERRDPIGEDDPDKSANEVNDGHLKRLNKCAVTRDPVAESRKYLCVWAVLRILHICPDRLIQKT